MAFSFHLFTFFPFIPPCVDCDLSRGVCNVSRLSMRLKSKWQMKFLWFCHSVLSSPALWKYSRPLAAGTRISESQWNNYNNNNSDINEAGIVRVRNKALCQDSVWFETAISHTVHLVKLPGVFSAWWFFYLLSFFSWVCFILCHPLGRVYLCWSPTLKEVRFKTYNKNTSG